ncbi:MAG: type I 3-dehydroquinate dehydratase [Acidobacteria bacterium]|nr:type I 3-dehydroquinate dehydratase [Acidobacteriota bacterium]MCA1651907.1 type I 3-dehydroquinate dehydratase [Acidobacteriota bacterium]
MRDPLICLTVTGRTMDEVRRRRDAAAGADMVEVRLDGVEDPDPAGAVDGRSRPVIVTCRPAWEGGAFDGSEEQRRRLLETAVAAGADFVDVEARAAFASDLIRSRRGRGIVLSFHEFGPVPEDLAQRAAAMRSEGAEVVKVAIYARALSDMLPLFDLAGTGGSEDSSHVLIAMGASGVASRLLSARLGNRWTYAGDGVVPGQIPALRMLNEFRFRRIRPDAVLYGLVGCPVGHSRSPAMHNAGFAALGLNAAYVPLETHDAADFVAFARGTGLRGASITAPLKVALLAHADEVDRLAARVGAINTLILRDGRWIGTNTDVAGFLSPLSGRIALRGVRASVLGAGGAARGVAVALADQGAAVTVCARRPEAAAQIARLVNGKVGSFPPASGTWDVLVNTIPALDGGANPIAGAPIDGEMVFDLVYAPAETQLLADARAAGCMTIGGMEMLVAQAERQFELWTGQRPPVGLFQAAAESAAQASDTVHSR